MSELRIGTTMWLTEPERQQLLPRSRSTRVGLVARVAAVCGVALAFVVGAVRPGPASVEAKGGTVTAHSPKATARLPDAARLAPEPEATGTVAAPHIIPKDPFHPALMALPAKFASVTELPPAAASFVPRPVVLERWTEEEFKQVDAIDGRTLAAGDLRIRLIGLDLPLPDQVCRTLDGRLEACASRAATQLELLTRWRQVTCHYRREPAGDAIGRCRIGTQDLSDRMIKTGYAWQTAARPADLTP
jgi:endonuclease YncB( thermonuclease family)